MTRLGCNDMRDRVAPWFLVRGLPLSLFWFFYFGGQGIFFPYYALYLHENAGLTGSQMGFVLGALPFMGFFAQPVLIFRLQLRT